MTAANPTSSGPPTHAHWLTAARENGWGLWRFVGVAAFVSLAVWIAFDPWVRIAKSGWRDEESSQILLVPIAFAWIVWARRDLLRNVRPTATWLGPLIVIVGWASLIYGYDIRDHEHWLFGAILIAVGCVVSFLGGQVLRRLWPAFVVLGFLIPVPGLIRMHVSLPLQGVMAQLAEHACGVLGIIVARSGNQLVVNGQTIEVAEACNGMRMVFALFLVVYTYAFATPLRWPVRLLLLIGAPVLALLCNLLRIVPTVLLYGYTDSEIGEGFHDAAGWIMVPLALIVLMGLLGVLQWAGVPVMQKPSSRRSAARPSAIPFRASLVAAPLMALLLLGGVAWSQQSRKPSPHVLAYHKSIRDAADGVGVLVGQWYGADAEVPTAAIKTLRPNVMISRRYQSVADNTGLRGFNLLFVHSGDAMDMEWHYPPVCYKMNGWTPTTTTQRRWRLGGLDVDLMEYGFRRDDTIDARSILICNFMVLPTGLGLDMDDVRAVAHDPAARVFGVAQVQFTFDEGTKEEQRRAVLGTFVQAYRPVIDAISNAPMSRRESPNRKPVAADVVGRPAPGPDASE